MTSVAHATVDASGRLLAADAALLSLNARAGGAVGLPLAIPALAGIVRLTRRLGVIVSRPLTVADDDADLDLWVRAQPAGADVRLSVSGWRAQRAWPGSADAGHELEPGWQWETDASLRLIYVALGAAERRGLAAESLLGAPITTLFTLEPHPDGSLPLVNAFADRLPLTAQRARLRGDPRPLLLQARVRHDAAGKFAGFHGTATFVEPDAPADAPALTSGFTEGLDRALRRPLSRIVANADSIHAEAEGPIARDYADYAADIASAGRHLLTMIDDLVDLQAIERPDFTVEQEPIDLADLARRAAGLLAIRAEQAGVTIDRPAWADSLPATGEFRRVLQILVNLLSNAVRYAPLGSAISVTCEQTGDHATVTVADQGPGIAPEDVTRVFEKFERLDPSEAGGSGLGLYIARRLARAMGGDLTLESQSGAGARFTLALPAR